ncbi:MAG: FecR domain-containing protein [Bacteroidetes bacterium]|nr:FecR domain-containing protein [Bacteroidota bacterium]
MPPQSKNDFLKLVEKYLDNTASADEIRALENYYAHFSDDADVTGSLNEEETSALKAALRQRIDDRIGSVNKPVIPLYRSKYFRAAAMALLFLTLAVYVINKQRHNIITLTAQNRFNLPPGGNKATLTLADGSKIDLNQLKNGAFTTQPGAHITKQNGQLAYLAANNSASSQVTYNTLTTPKGGQFELELADGTRVWLNAASSLTFPTAFTGDERVVELTGEAYFDVAHNAKQPFKVKTANQVVQDIGTQFNINSYADEDAVTTTLVEGSVKVYNANGQTLIKPGQQYLLKNNGVSEVKNDVDLNEVTAWKDGMFQFNNADIKTIMRQIGRWYNVSIEYAGQVPASTYHGRISRNSNATDVLNILELSGINFTIEGRKIIVK